jgi:RES domain-containing protein
MRTWRISNYADLSGIGGKYKAGRWNQLGTPIIYCAEHPALAMLEMLVHFDAEDLPETYRLLEIEVPDTIVPVSPELTGNWRDDPEITRDLFDAFCSDAASPVMTVPSVVMPHAFNHLINPRHPDAGSITIKSAIEHPLDPRFLG